jgi:hypothetical protein
MEQVRWSRIVDAMRVVGAVVVGCGALVACSSAKSAVAPTEPAAAPTPLVGVVGCPGSAKPFAFGEPPAVRAGKSRVDAPAFRVGWCRHSDRGPYGPFFEWCTPDDARRTDTPTGCYRNGRRDGAWTYYYPTGAVSRREHYIDGKLLESKSFELIDGAGR